MTNQFIQTSHIQTFANEKVNIKDDAVKEYREQVNSLKQKLEKHIQENPDFGLVKMLNSGSLAKGTALKTINDIDVAVFLKQSIETKESKLLASLMERLKEAYSNLDADQFVCPSGSHCVTISF